MKNRKPFIILPLLAMGISAISFAANNNFKEADAAFYSTASLPTTIDLNLVDETTVRNYYSQANGLNGDNLLIKLKDILKTNQVYYPYGAVIWNMYEITDRDTNLSPWTDIPGYNSRTNKITGYTYNASSSDSDTVGNPYIRALYVDRNKSNPMRAHGNHQQTYGGFNREHIWPKSHGFDDESSEFANGARGDPMHLWPGDGKTNNAHSNYYYGNVSRSNYTFNSATVLDYAGANYLGKSSSVSSSQNVFEPQDSDKGDIARAVFYMAARYNNLSGTDNNINAANPALILDNTPNTNTGTATSSTPYALGLLKDMLEWNKLDPVDDFEIQRNDILYRNYTKNRNPFIDFPEWADIIWGGKSETASPSTDAFHGVESGEVSLTVSNSNLEIIGVGSTDSLTVNASDGGTYSLSIINSDNTVVSVASSGSTGSAISITTLKEGTSTLTFTANINGNSKSVSAIITVTSESQLDTISTTIVNTDYTDGYESTGTSGTIDKTISSTNDLRINYSGINTKSSATATAYSYNAAFYVKNSGYSYSSTVPSGYYPSKVSVKFTSGTSTSGKIGVSFTSSVNSSRDSTVANAVTQSGTYEVTNSDPTKLYWNISTTNANVQIAKIDIEYTKKQASSASLELSDTTLEGFVGETGELLAVASNFEGDVTYSYETDDSSIVRVEQDGDYALLRYVGAGEAMITCTATDGVDMVEATCLVTVEDVPVVLDRIEVTKKTTTFNLGASFTKGTVYAYYSDGTSALVTSKCLFTGYDLSQVGTQTVHVSYTEDGVTKTTSYTISVVGPQLVSIAVANPKLEYDVGDAFAKPTVNATYSNDSVEDVTSEATFTGYNLSNPGVYTVQVSYTDEITVNTSYTIKVYSFEIDTTPYKHSLFGPSYNSKSVTSYNSSWSSTTEGFVTYIENANNNANKWEYIKMGMKGGNSTGSLTSEQIDKPIYRVGLVIDAVDTNYVTSAKLYSKVGSENYVELGDFTLSPGESKITIPSSLVKSDAIYRLEFDMIASGGSNGFLQISEVKFYSGDKSLPENLQDISVETTKTTYYVGETLDASSLDVKAIYPSSTKSIDLADVTINDADHMFTYADSDIGTYTYDVTAMGITKTLTVNVMRKAYELPSEGSIVHNATVIGQSTIGKSTSDASTGTVQIGDINYEVSNSYVYSNKYISFTKNSSGSYDETRYLYNLDPLGSGITSITVTMSSGEAPNIYVSKDKENWVEYSADVVDSDVYCYYKLDYSGSTYSGYVNISNISIGIIESDTAINLANYIMYADTVNQCVTKYEFALSVFNSLTKQEKIEFATSSDYVISAARARFEAWAEYHGQTLALINGEYAVSSNVIVKISSSSVSSLITIALVAAGSFISLAFVSKRMKHRNK